MKKIIILILSLFLITGCSLFNKETVVNSEVNNNADIIKEQIVGNFTVSNISLVYLNGTSNFDVNITNNTEEELTISRFNVTFKTKSGTVITTISGNTGIKVQPKGSIEESMVSDIDLSNAYSVEYDIG